MKKPSTPRCPKCGGTKLRIVENANYGLFVFCPTRGCFTFPVNVAGARPGVMPEALHKLAGALSLAQVQELRKIRLDPGAGVISAIKRLREMLGCGLKEAHDYVRDYLLLEKV